MGKISVSVLTAVIYAAAAFFTALHGMQRGLNDEISVRLSVRLSVCQTRAL